MHLPCHRHYFLQSRHSVLLFCLTLCRGNYPYPSSYILNGMGILPAYPVRVACESLREKDLKGTALLSAFADALGVFYNYSKVMPYIS